MKHLLFIFLLYTASSASTVYIIASQPIKTSKKELKNFFFAKSDYLDGKKYQRTSNKEALESLAVIAFDTTKNRLSKKWIKRNFRKGTPFPISLRNDAKTIEWIKNHDNAVGFIRKKSNDVNIIYTFRE